MEEEQRTEPAALREILRWGERTLDAQETARESVRRRAAELLRLSVAAIGGVILVSGILVTADARVDLLSALAGGVGLVLLVVAVGFLAMVLVSFGHPNSLACGPDFLRIADRLRAAPISEQEMLGSFVLGIPEWIQANENVVARLQRLSGWGLAALTGAAVVLLSTLLYIVGGGIHG